MMKEFAKIGARCGFEPIPLNRCRLTIGAKPGCGKSTFVMSIPKALVFDYDLGSQQVIHQTAHAVPMKHNQDKPVWDLHAQVMELLVKQGNQKNRPIDMVVFDTLDKWYATEMRRILDDHNDKIREKRNFIPADLATTFGDINDHGASWIRLYDKIRADLHILNSLGYGWIVMYHISPSTIKVRLNGVEQEITTWGPTIGGKLPGYIHADSEVVAQIDRMTRRTKSEPKTKEIAGGRTIKVPGKEVSKTTYVLKMSTPDDHQDAKSRLRLPPTEIVLPDRDGWAAFEKIYNRGIAEALEMAKI